MSMMSSDWDGRETMVLAREVVPGDLMTIESRDTVLVDARIVEPVELRTDEAVITAESNPIAKGIEPVNRTLRLVILKTCCIWVLARSTAGGKRSLP